VTASSIGFESKGLLERRGHPTDGRITRIHSSAVVKRFVAERLPELSRGPLERALDRASRAEQAQIGEVVRRLRELLDETRMEVGREGSQERGAAPEHGRSDRRVDGCRASAQGCIGQERLVRGRYKAKAL